MISRWNSCIIQCKTLWDLIENDDGVVPVEVKSTDGRSRSLDALIESDAIPYGIKLTGGNVGTSGKKVTLPHYMAMFL